jgi:hypothetical protein
MGKRIFFLMAVLLLAAAAGCKPSTKTPAPTQVASDENFQAPAPATAVPTPLPPPTATASPAPSPTAAQPTLDPTAVGFYPVDMSQPVKFEVEKTNQLAPADIMNEIAFSDNFGGGGGSCYDVADNLTELKFIEEPTGSAEWNDSIDFLACGWKDGEKVQYRITAPDGKVVHDEVIDSKDFTIDEWLYFTPELNSLPGVYRITLISPSGTIETRANVILPQEPRAYLLKDKLILYNFQPDEAVAVYLYQGIQEGLDTIWSIYNFSNYQVSKTGQLAIQLISKSADLEGKWWYVLIGEKTGEVRTYPRIQWTPWEPVHSPFGIMVQSEGPAGAEVKNLWTLLKYKERYSPGVNTYDLAVQPEDVIRWRFTWCAKDKDTLKENLSKLDLTFWVDNFEVSENRITGQSFTSDNTWECRRFATYAYQWKTGENHTLELHYHLEGNVNDGASTYYAGDYKQVVNVTVK